MTRPVPVLGDRPTGARTGYRDGTMMAPRSDVTVLLDDPVPATGPSLGRRIWYCWLEARPPVQLMFALRFLSGGVFAADAHWWSHRDRLLPYALALSAWVCATLFTYLINGAMDVTEDRVNGLTRPIGRGDLDAATAYAMAWVFAALALTLGFVSGTAVVAPLVVFLALGYAYSVPPLRLNRTSYGSMAVVVLGGLLTYYAGWLAVGLPLRLPAVLFGLAMSVWMGLPGAVVKDLSDIRGDRAGGRRTLATRCREVPLRRGVAFATTALGVVFALVATVTARQILASASVVLVGACCVASSTLTTHSTDGRRRSRRPYRAFMVTQYLAHVALLA